ncbi:hypothetical protein [Nocardioides marmorisolisilvae]|uniref:Uncharacterized protein n=1 Tax=Nocardioides marmorisolisilvae TaxID=1542737 RepID=A0A3N0DRR0_9ACTN|nr:hypothetical protein [Nocardioides marmorisolisilvae]RNL78324.1 hypothetical protein EFL95_04240 [Nocardioides marmorisolisilvae]
MAEMQGRWLAWGERTRLHQAVAVADVVLILGFAVLLVASSSQPLTWIGCVVVCSVVLVDYWLTWKRLGELGRR